MTSPDAPGPAPAAEAAAAAGGAAAALTPHPPKRTRWQRWKRSARRVFHNPKTKREVREGGQGGQGGRAGRALWPRRFCSLRVWGEDAHGGRAQACAPKHHRPVLDPRPASHPGVRGEAVCRRAPAARMQRVRPRRLPTTSLPLCRPAASAPSSPPPIARPLSHAPPHPLNPPLPSPHPPPPPRPSLLSPSENHVRPVLDPRPGGGRRRRRICHAAHHQAHHHPRPALPVGQAAPPRPGRRVRGHDHPPAAGLPALAGGRLAGRLGPGLWVGLPAGDRRVGGRHGPPLPARPPWRPARPGGPVGGAQGMVPHPDDRGQGGRPRQDRLPHAPGAGALRPAQLCGRPRAGRAFLVLPGRLHHRPRPRHVCPPVGRGGRQGVGRRD